MLTTASMQSLEKTRLRTEDDAWPLAQTRMRGCEDNPFAAAEELSSGRVASDPWPLEGLRAELESDSPSPQRRFWTARNVVLTLFVCLAVAQAALFIYLNR